jgi:hypothetical protein
MSIDKPEVMNQGSKFKLTSLLGVNSCHFQMYVKSFQTFIRCGQRRTDFPDRDFPRPFLHQLLEKPLIKIISGLYETRLYSNQVSSVKFDSSIEFKLEFSTFLEN